MFNIAIIGAGQLGSRHLQGLARVETPLSIYLLDPYESSLELARSRYTEVAGALAPHQLHLCSDISMLPDTLELAISATTADHRLASLQQVLGRISVKNLVLEKVLFQRLEEYKLAAELLQRAGTRCWVNCARRMFPGYQRIKEFFGDDVPFLLQVSGGNWGLGCNGIHFCDLFAYLTGSDEIDFDANQLDNAAHASKRAGFFEFSGTLVGRQGGRQLVLQSRVDASLRHLVLIRSSTKTVLVDEVAGSARLLDESNGTWSELSFPVPYQSQLTTTLANAILCGQPPGLPDFASSARIHAPFVSTLTTHFNRVTSQQGDVCPIT